MTTEAKPGRRRTAARQGWRTIVEAATVRVRYGKTSYGQGVLVPGGFILTAMHCINWSGDAGIVLGDHHPIPIEPKKPTRSFLLAPAYADVVSDMAALDDLDGQVYPHDVEAFQDWRDRTRAVPIREWRPRGLESERAFVLAHTGEWIAGEVRNYSHREHAWPTIAINTRAPLKGGTSGGPVVDRQGRLIGVVSHTSGHDGAIPLACATLTPWIIRRVLEWKGGRAEEEEAFQP